MNEFKLKTAVAFFIYKRPEYTIRSFREIAKAKPEKLFIIADGPTSLNENWDVLTTRNIVKSIDWDCEVFRNYSEENLGCGKRLVSGLQWVFSHVEEAIIIEDDIVPSQSFFRYCQELLDHHRTNEKVFSISGCNIGFANQDIDSSYYYSNFMNMWGWATWKRSFEKIDFNVEFWPTYKHSDEFKTILSNDTQWITFWENTFDRVYQGEIDTWDFQWILSQLFNRAYSIFPITNLIENIGFGAQATHTTDSNLRAGNLLRGEFSFPINHPDLFASNRRFEKYIKTVWCGLETGSKQNRLVNFWSKATRRLF